MTYMVPIQTNTDGRISIVSDVSNAIVPDSLSMQLKSATHIEIVNTDNSLPKDCSAAEIAQRITGPYRLLVAAVGVPDDSGYQNRIHTLLNAWAILPQKPAVLIVSPAPPKATQIVHSWIESRTDLVPLRPAIAVNDPYLLMAGRDNVIMQLQNQLHVAEQLNQLLLNSLQTPTDIVRSPTITPNANLVLVKS